MKLSVLKDNHGSRKRKKLLGRGIGSGKGKTSGRGGKGQTARSGVAINGFEGGQMPIHRRLPKRGFNSYNKELIDTINLGKIQQLIDQEKLPATGVITKQHLLDLKLIYSLNRSVKLLAKGEIKSPVTIEVDLFSKAAQIVLTKAGGIVAKS